MSSRGIEIRTAVQSERECALEHLRSAQALIDQLDRPDIGARLQEVIDTLSDSADAAGETEADG